MHMPASHEREAATYPWQIIEAFETTSVLCRALLAWIMARKTAAVVPYSLSATLQKQSRLTPSAWIRSSQRSAAILCCMIMTSHSSITDMHPVTESCLLTFDLICTSESLQLQRHMGSPRDNHSSRLACGNPHAHPAQPGNQARLVGGVQMTFVHRREVGC